MKSIHKYASPNVVPGTNFNNERFQEMYAWITALSTDAARSIMAPNQYGLLTAFDGQTALQLEKKEGLIILRRCTGITPCGYIVGVFEDITPVLETHLDLYDLDPKKAYYVLIEMHGIKRQAFGPESEDLPQRPQFSMPASRLHIQDTRQESGKWANAFPVGLLVFETGEWKLANYIPPCSHLGANLLLCQKYSAYKEAIKVMLQAQPNIIRQTDSFRDKAMIELREFALQSGSFLASRKPGYFSLSEKGTAFDMVEFWMAFANQMDFLLNCLTDRPGFYNLLYINTRSVNGVMLTTERLDKALFDLNNQAYEHQNISKIIAAIDEFLALIVPMFKALGNGTIKPTGNTYEEVYKAPVEVQRKSHITW